MYYNLKIDVYCFESFSALFYHDNRLSFFNQTFSDNKKSFVNYLSCVYSLRVWLVVSVSLK